MGYIRLNINGHNAFPMKNDNWHKFQPTGKWLPYGWGQEPSYLSKLNTKSTKIKKSRISLGLYDAIWSRLN